MLYPPNRQDLGESLPGWRHLISWPSWRLGKGCEYADIV
jgi:hypothetical protein